MPGPARRKSTVREAFATNIIDKPKKFAGKLRGRYLFRAYVRRVIEYKEWIGDILEDHHIGDDVSVNVKLAQRKKSDLESLTIKDRSVLLIPPKNRKSEHIAYIEGLIKDMKMFKRYPEDIQESLAAECIYQYVLPGKTIIRQDHKALNLYYIIRGQLQILKDVTDNITGEVTQMDVGMLKPGDIFGEIALLHKVSRTATVVSKTSADLMCISKRVFNDNLRSLLLEEWDILRDALVHFNYFKNWSDETMRECCILSKIINYKPNEILLGDGKGMVHYVYFLLSGECRLIEHMLIEKYYDAGKEKYKLYDSQKDDKKSRLRIGRNTRLDLSDESLGSLTMGSDKEMLGDGKSMSAAEYIKLVSAKKSTNVAMERISVITVTLQDVINQWHEITDAVEMLMKRPSVTTLREYPTYVQTIFMQICIFYRGACFGLGEQMKNRRVVSITSARCLLIPRFWLTEHNRANIWERVKNFMNSKYPNTKQLFNRFVENRMWTKHKKEYADRIIKQGRYIPNDTKYCHVPYSIRINESIDDHK